MIMAEFYPRAALFQHELQAVGTTDSSTDGHGYAQIAAQFEPMIKLNQISIFFASIQG